MSPTSPELRQFIIEFFSDEELETLCFDYFREVHQNFTVGMTKNRKAILLIAYCESRDRLEHLRAALALSRPEAWNRQFAAAEGQKPSFFGETRFLNERDPRQIFLSHATADAKFAHQLADDLRAEGWQVWIAPESIRPGEKWVEAIDRGMETSGVFVVVLTPAAVASRWVRTETNAAITLEHQSLIRFLPLDVVECDIPLLWSGYQYVPFRGGYEVGLDALFKWLDATLSSDEHVEWLKSLPDKVFPPKITQGPPPAPPARERRVKEEQWRQLQALAQEIAAELGRQSGDDELREVYRRFNRHFGLGGYKQLPRRRFEEGMAFMTKWRHEITAIPVETFHGNVSVSREPDAETVQRTVSTLPDHYIHEKTGIELIRIPAGPFLYGEGKSQRTIELPEYWIGRYPLTNAQYKRFLDANPNYDVPFQWGVWSYNWDKKMRAYPVRKADHPVVLVDWYGTQAYCEWAGLALPTEEEWEKAARGSDGLVYPWGDDPPTAEHCNFNGNVGATTPVGRYSPRGDSPYGCADMAGNVWEWTESGDEARRVLRGGSWLDLQGLTRAASRSNPLPAYRERFVGFRVVRRPPSQAL